MQFLMLVCDDPTAEPFDPARNNIEEWVEQADAAGTRALGDRLAAAGEARTVRVRGGRTTVTDGPFAEFSEMIAGFDILICDTLDEAVELAAKHPMARFGQLEVRPFYSWS
ncbi:YciI family protein [Cellulomonas rhizosphaerae]|uniref:YCII-related domain-containing protein n=1 Tax=Cellulomonas rhizosphaerae TaxID=2293719 RepID=A0A413RQT2_9CELL|nr:YciI family protein [Cellulomonas rhizosphaerae]RHA44303.1 hypothetical protein D1825_01930 [Cellulomonas rhizosphaerae]